jgi:hypothetical protein
VVPMNSLAEVPPMYDYSWIRILITVLALIVLALSWMYPSKAKIDAFGIALLVIALLPWIVPIMHITELDFAGGNVIKMQETIERIERDNSLSAEEIKQLRQLLQVTTNMARRENPTSIKTLEEQITDLKNKYTDLRSTPSGDQRTAEMTTVVSQLVPLMVRMDNYDPIKDLSSSTPADRLAAIAYIYGKPDLQYLDPLIGAATKEVQPFIQYWAVQALGSVLALPRTERLKEDQLKSLRVLLKVVDSPNDHGRYLELQRIIQNLPELVPPGEPPPFDESLPGAPDSHRIRGH